MYVPQIIDQVMDRLITCLPSVLGIKLKTQLPGFVCIKNNDTNDTKTSFIVQHM